MAGTSPEAQILSRIKTDHLTCQICQGRYKYPKALPCLHTFCSECLQDFVFSRRYEERGSFPCPVCRATIELSKDGVEGFPDNHFIVTLMDTVNTDDGAAAGTTSLYPDLSGLMAQSKLGDKGALGACGASGGVTATVSPISAFVGKQRSQLGAVAPPKPRRLVQPPPRPTNKPVKSPPRNLPQRPSPPSGVLRHRAHPGNSGRSPRGHDSSADEASPTCSAPLQRKMVLSGDSYPVPVVWNTHGAEVSFGQYGPNLTEFQKPVGLAVSPEGFIVVGDQRDNRVFIFERSGRLKTMFTCQGTIQDIDINSRGLIYVANTQAKRSLVTCYNTRGHTVASLGSFFTFEKPHGVAITEDNHMAVTSIDTHQVYLLNEYGKMTHKFTGKGKDGKRLNYPYHVTVSKKNKIIVSDYGNDCVKIFDNTGKCKVQFGKYGVKSGQFNGPRGLCVDNKDNILVTDSRNHRVQVFSSKGQFLGVAMEIGQEDAGMGACPMNVAVTNNSKLVVLFSGGSFAQVRIYPYTF